MMRRLTILRLLLACVVLPVTSHGIVVASLNAVVTDIVRQVGGERVTIVELMKPGQDPHVFRPSPADLRAAQDANLVMAAGKGLETYLDSFRGNLGPDHVIVEVGRMIPSQRVAAADELFVCCPAHAMGSIDPHWWLSIRNMQRAARIVAHALAEQDPEGEAYYEERYRTYTEELEELARWARKEIARIPRRERILTTSHAAYGYFCREFGFKSIPVQGLSTDDDPKPRYLGDVVDTIRREGIHAVFPEVTANPKVMEAMVEETGVTVGTPLLPGSPDPSDPTYVAMMRHNVESIVTALAPPERTE